MLTKPEFLQGFEKKFSFFSPVKHTLTMFALFRGGETVSKYCYLVVYLAKHVLPHE
jgi:hypothetical protein